MYKRQTNDYTEAVAKLQLSFRAYKVNHKVTKEKDKVIIDKKIKTKTIKKVVPVQTGDAVSYTHLKKYTVHRNYAQTWYDDGSGSSLWYYDAGERCIHACVGKSDRERSDSLRYFEKGIERWVKRKVFSVGL